MSLFHLLKQRRRSGQRESSEVHIRDDGWQTSATDILRVFREHMRSNYRPVQVDEDSVRTMLETDTGMCLMLGRRHSRCQLRSKI
jgi:hypothetical protein